MALREFLHHNLWLKLVALLLATLMWLTVRFTIHQEQGQFQAAAAHSIITNTWANVPIMVLRDSHDPRNYQLEPSDVSVSAVGEAQRLRQLTARDFKVFVDLSVRESTPGSIRNIEVIYPAGIDSVMLSPPTTRVIRASTPEPMTPKEKP